MRWSRGELVRVAIFEESGTDELCGRQSIVGRWRRERDDQKRIGVAGGEIVLRWDEKAGLGMGGSVKGLRSGEVRGEGSEGFRMERE